MRRIDAEFAEMPGMRLTCDQARRLFGIARNCQELLDTLVSERVLTRYADGTYARRAESLRGALSPLRDSSERRGLARSA